MLKISNESTEEEMIKKEQTELEGEFYYMSTRYKSLIPLINEVKAQRGEIQELKRKLTNTMEQVEKITRYIETRSNNSSNKKSK